MARILTVDDDPVTTLIVRTALEKHGHQLVCLVDPRLALEVAVMERVEGVVLDVVMPGLSGHEVLQGLRADERTRDLPVVFLSSLGEAPQRIQGLREGADDYIVKPFEPEELVLRVERLLASRPAEASQGWPASDRSAATPRFGRYEVIEEMGQGGGGTIYRAWDPKLERQVALKTIRRERDRLAPAGRDTTPQLLREAVAAARLSHPNVVSVFDVGDDRGDPFLALELVDGISLGEHLRVRTRLGVDQVVPLGVAIAEGLAAAHAEGLVHHDVKSDNVLLSWSGAIKLTDFGLAQFISTLAAASGSVFGTPGYLPPEVFTGRGSDARGDLYGLGVILYEALTGHLPFVAPSIPELVSRVRDCDPPPVGQSVPDLLPALGRLVDQLLRREPKERPESAGLVAASLAGMALTYAFRWEPPSATPRVAGQHARAVDPAPSRVFSLAELRATSTPSRRESDDHAQAREEPSSAR